MGEKGLSGQISLVSAAPAVLLLEIQDMQKQVKGPQMSLHGMETRFIFIHLIHANVLENFSWDTL